jgi:putative ABC transport system ATP-binding protein
MLKLTAVSKVYNQGQSNAVTALDNVSLTIGGGESVSVMGRSGSGKSTLLNILAGLDGPTSGSYIFNAAEMVSMTNARLSATRNSEIGVVLQDFALIDNQTAMSNVKLPMYFDKTPLREMKRKAETAIELVGITKLANRKVGEMSGGQKQRVAIARSLVNNPILILADEPTGALDSATTAEILEVFSKLNELGKTVVIVTHDEQVSRFCKRHIIIDDGKVAGDTI